MDREVEKDYHVWKVHNAARAETGLPFSDFRLCLGTEILDGPDAQNLWETKLNDVDAVDVSLFLLGDLGESDDEMVAEFVDSLSCVGPYDAFQWTSAGRSRRCCLSLLARVADMVADYSCHAAVIDHSCSYYDACAAPYISRRLLHDREFVLDAVSDGAFFLLYYTDARFMNDVDILEVAAGQHPAIIGDAGDLPQDDRGVANAALAEDPAVFEHVSERLRGDREIALATVSRCGIVLQHVTAGLASDVAVVLSAVKNDGLALEHAHATLTSDPAVVLPAVKNNGLALKHAHPTLQDDEEIVMAAVRQDPRALEFASGRLQNTVDVVEAASRRHGVDYVNEFIGENVLGSDELFLRVPFLLSRASDDILGDRALFERLLPTYPWTWMYASRALKEDADLALVALRNWRSGSGVLASVCKAIPAEFLADKDLMLPIVGACGSILSYCCSALKADVDVAMAAVRNRRSALKFVRDDNIVLDILVSVRGFSERNLKELLGKRRGSVIWEAYLERCPDECRLSLREEQMAASRGKRRRTERLKTKIASR